MDAQQGTMDENRITRINVSIGFWLAVIWGLGSLALAIHTPTFSNWMGAVVGLLVAVWMRRTLAGLRRRA
jgi:hypothetical protein